MHSAYLYNLPCFRDDQSAATSRTSHLSADRRHHWQGLVANKGQSMTPTSIPDEVSYQRKTRRETLSSTPETLVWDHQTMEFLYVLGFCPPMLEFRRAHLKRNVNLISKFLQKDFSKSKLTNHGSRTGPQLRSESGAELTQLSGERWATRTRFVEALSGTAKLSRYRAGLGSERAQILRLTNFTLCVTKNSPNFVFNPVTLCRTELFIIFWHKFKISILHGVWKSQKKSHSTLRAKRATFAFWVDKS